MVFRSTVCAKRGQAPSLAWNPVFHQSAQYHEVVSWKTCDEWSSARNKLTLYSTVNTWCSDGKFVMRAGGMQRSYHNATLSLKRFSKIIMKLKEVRGWNLEQLAGSKKGP